MTKIEQKIEIVEYGSPTGYLIEAFLKQREVNLDNGEVREIEVLDGTVLQVKSDGDNYILMFNHTKIPF